MSEAPRITLLLDSLKSGGIARVAINLSVA